MKRNDGSVVAEYDNDETTAFISDVPPAVQRYMQPWSRVRTRPMARKMLDDLRLACLVPDPVGG